MNRAMRILFAMMLVSAASGACEEETAATVEHAYGIAWNDCAPWDGPAVTVVLSDSPDSIPHAVPRLVLSVWQSAGTLAGTTVELGSSKGSAQECDGADSCEVAEEGWVRFDVVSSDEVRGSFRLQFPGRAIRGSFRARWLERQLLCG